MVDFGRLRRIGAAALVMAGFLALSSPGWAQGLEELKAKALAGNIQDQIKLGESYYYGEFGAASDYAEALRWFLMAAEKGDAEAQAWAGSLYTGMKGVPYNSEKAKFWMNKAIAQGSGAAAYSLSGIYKDEGNYPEALRFMKLYGELSGDELYEEDREFLARDVAALESLVSTSKVTGGTLTVGPEPSPPDLLPGEFIQHTTNGCKIVSWLPDVAPDAVRKQAEQRKLEWDGRCHHGLAHGKGKLFGASDAEFSFGYWLGAPVTQNERDGNQFSFYMVPSLGAGTTINTGPETSFAPAWPRATDTDFTTATVIQMHDTLNWNQFHVSTTRSVCYDHFKSTMTAAEKKALSGKRCRGNSGDIQVYYVKASTNTHASMTIMDTSGFRHADHFCPDPKSSKGCESVWTREVAPFLPRMTMLVESATALAARRPEQDRAVAAWADYDKKLEAWKQARLDADKAAADRARVQKAAAAELARLEAEARKEAEQKEFADSLKTLNPGQLLAKADELEQEGRIDHARTLRREIISRFPDHPLAVVAAQKLTDTSKVATGPEAEFAALRERAETGDVAAQLEIALAYYAGKGIAQDRPEAARWYRRAADQGNAEAQNYLGVILYDGLGVAQNDAEAALYYRLAADQGHASAQSNLGMAYFSGRGVVQDRKEAARWYKLAADQGSASAQNYLGVMLYNGQDLPENDPEAVRYFRLAANQGHASAQNNLGNAYRYGHGVTQNIDTAISWYRAASERGHEDAAATLAAIENQLAEEAYQKRLAQQRADAQREEALRAEEQRQRQQENNSSQAWGMLAAGGLAAALGGNTNDVLGAMLGQPVVSQPTSSGGSSSQSISCTGANLTVSCLMEQCRARASERQRSNPGHRYECRVSTDRRGVDCVHSSSDRVSDSSMMCVDGMGTAR